MSKQGTAQFRWASCTETSCREMPYVLDLPSSTGEPDAIDTTATWQSSDAVATRLPVIFIFFRRSATRPPPRDAVNRRKTTQCKEKKLRDKFYRMYAACA